MFNELLLHLVFMLKLNVLFDKLSTAESFFANRTPVLLSFLYLYDFLSAELVFQLV